MTGNANAYKQAGVDIEAGNSLVERIKPHVAATKRSGIGGTIGGFGALLDLKETGYSDPLLVAATDGVGTKLRIALESGLHETVGIDLVAMCVNDLVVQGAEPLFFLDYFATGKLDVDQGESVIRGIAAGCKEAGCALVGGETAEMPGMYHGGDYDLAGFCVGAVERDQVLTGKSIAPGDVVLGLASSGAHSNGFSLIRKLVEDSGLDYKDQAPFESNSLAASLLTPTRIYVRPLLKALKETKTAKAIKGLAHITGGGLVENIPRILPDGLCVRIDGTSWSMPPLFHWLKEQGTLSWADMALTFNCGIGMVVVCSAKEVEEVRAILKSEGEDVYIIGLVEETSEKGSKVKIEGWDKSV